MTKIQQKRTRPVEKAWYIVKPLVFYTMIKTFVILGLSLLVSSMPQDGISVWVTNNSKLLSTSINGIAALIGVSFVLQDFLKEVAVIGEIDIDSGVIKQLLAWGQNGIKHNKDKIFHLAAVVSLGITSALGLNILIELLSIRSDSYSNVEAIQYSVPLWLGLLLYGLVSPITEEIIFRGITYNRMKRFFGVVPCILVTALLFGGFHANLPQFLYGTCMGVLMAFVYEWVKSFAAPLLFHMAANLVVFVLSFSGLEAQIVSIITGMTLLALSILLLLYLYKNRIKAKS